MEAEKLDQYVMFLDTSGSVGGSINYWTTVNDVLALYGPKIKKYYFWNSNLEPVDKKRFQKAIQERKGWGGTSPSLVATSVVTEKYKSIILITDGQVGDYDVQNCDKILGDYKFDRTICYIISSGHGQVNMSVTCPFTRNCQNKVYKKERDSQLKAVVEFTPEDYKILDALDVITLENFQAEYDKIEGLIIALNMGKTGNIPLKNNLVVMKNRLVKQLSKQKGGQKKQLSDQIREHLEKNDFGSAIQIVKGMSNTYFADNMTTDLQKKISHLINLCGDLTGKYNINQIKSNKMATAKDATEGKIDVAVQVNDLSKNTIECPILNEDDVPQILIDECEPLLLGVEKNIVDDIAACPLRLLNYPDLKAKLKSRLSNFIGVMGIEAKLDKKLLKNPFTQNKLLGSIPLGTHKSHVKVGNYTIAQMISGGKILGNLNLYYAVVWYLIKQGNIEYLKDIQKNASEHLIFRLKNSKTMASLCGQAQFVTTQISTDIAVWYCVNSGYLNQPTDRDTFRFHYYNLEPMMKIVEELGYPNDKGLMPHYHRTKNLLNLLSIYKNIKSPSDKKTLKNLVIGLYQNGVFVNPKDFDKKFKQVQVCSAFIPIDGQASEQQILKIRNWFGDKYKFTQPLTNQQLLYIVNLIDPQKSASAYFLDYNIVIPQMPKGEINWKYGLKDFQDTVKICPKTLRPFYHVQENKTWQQAATLKFNMPVRSLFNGYKYFQNFVLKYQRQPTAEELITFYYNRYIQSGKIKTLPFLIQKWSKSTCESYKFAFETIKIKDIVKLFNVSREIQKRCELENNK